MKLIYALLLFSSFASASEKISAHAYPYLGTLTDPALSVEKELVDKATQVCGSLQNVRYLTDVKVSFRTSEFAQIHPDGVLGGDVFHGILILAYPELNVDATVDCKDEAR